MTGAAIESLVSVGPSVHNLTGEQDQAHIMFWLVAQKKRDC